MVSQPWPPQSDRRLGALQSGGCPTVVEAVVLLGQRGCVQITGRAGVHGHLDFLGCGGGCRSLEGWVLLLGYD
jgi:hypothetical protein